MPTSLRISRRIAVHAWFKLMGIQFPNEIVISMLQDALDEKYEIVIVPDDLAENNEEFVKIMKAFIADR